MKIRERILTEETIVALVTLVAEEIDAMAGELSSRLEVIEAELSDVKKRLEKLYEAIETSELTLEVLSPRVMSLRHREEQLEAARDDAETQLEYRRVELPNTEEITQYVADFRDFLQEGTIPERKALIRNFVEGIEVVGDEATLTYTVPMPSDGVTSESASVLDFVKSGPPSCIVDTMALRGLLGDEARVSASTVARLKEKWHAELAEWRQRPLDDLEVVYMWVDGVYVKAGLEKGKAAILVVLAALSDGSKVVVTAMPGYRESTESWSEVLRGLKERGLECPRLVIGDGHLGIWGALRNVYPEAAEQRCWNHKILNVLDKLPKREHAQAKLLLCRIPYSQSRKEAERLRSIFSTWCHERAHQTASEALERDWERMVTFYHLPREHWQHLRTTNPVESPFAALRLRTDAAKRYKRVDRATAVIWKMLMIAEKRFRRLKAPGLMRDVYLGTLYMDGMAIEATVEEVAA